MMGDVVDFIEMEKLLKPSTYSSEIQERMVLDGIVHPSDVLSKASITKCVWSDHLTKSLVLHRWNQQQQIMLP